MHFTLLLGMAAGQPQLGTRIEKLLGRFKLFFESFWILTLRYSFKLPVRFRLLSNGSVDLCDLANSDSVLLHVALILAGVLCQTVVDHRSTGSMPVSMENQTFFGFSTV